MTRTQRLLRDESGMTYVFVGLGMMALLSASMLAIDVGMLMTARSQAQNSADAGALAGATALAYDDWDDRSDTGAAVKSAIAAAKLNEVMADTVSVTPADVEFLPDPVDGTMDRVKVTVRRANGRADSEGHGGGVDTLIARYFGTPKADIVATATAEASPANAMTCVKPFTIPDKWIENRAPIDTFDRYGKKAIVLSPADVYVPAKDASGNPDPNYSGYNSRANLGKELVLRAALGGNISPGFYFSLAMTSDTGGDDYRWNIENCNHTIYHWGDPLVQEPGAMQGPTIQGIEALIAKDPNAVWDKDTNTVKNSAFPERKSPRIFPIPLFDPDYYQQGQETGRVASLKTANWIGFFVEYIGGSSEIHGRIIPISGIRDKTAPRGTAAFPVSIRLVQ